MPGRSGPHPDPAFSADVQRFSDYLADIGQPYLLLDAPGGQQVRVRFTGRFQGSAVVWDCRFMTLDAAAQSDRTGLENDPAVAGPCFIEIGQAGDHGIPLRVGLDLAVIDIPAIRKMIVMIRNYKRLHEGRHEFGSAHESTVWR